MIQVYLGINNPWRKDAFDNIFCFSKSLTTNKFIEVECIYHDYNLVEVEFSITTRRDHAGLSMVAGVLGYRLELSIRDSRHWDSSTNNWE